MILRRARRLAGWLLAGDRRVWRIAAIAGLPAVVLVLAWCLIPRGYYTGTDSASAYTGVAATEAGHATCVPGLRLPAGTSRIQLKVISLTQLRPRLQMTLDAGARRLTSTLGPQPVGPNHQSTAIFPIPPTSVRPASVPATICLRAGGLVNWEGAMVGIAGGPPPTTDGVPLKARIAVWYLPAAGRQRSYVQAAGDIFRRAALFRPGILGAWLYPVLLLGVLPLLALAAVRLLAQASAGRRRGLARWLFAICALNAACWALITPIWQAPDEVDHFAYTQALVEKGQAPYENDRTRPPWSSAEYRSLFATGMLVDHFGADSRDSWLQSDAEAYRRAVATTRPSRADGGGLTSAATHGPLYYLALAPAYLAAPRDAPFTQMTLMRLTSALIAGLVAVFAFLMMRELAPGRPWLGVLAALLISFQPMYGFISGSVNNDVGINAAAAGLELLLLRIITRGLSLGRALATGALLLLLPLIKGTGYSLFPVALLVLASVLWRQHRREDAPRWAALALAALAVQEAWTRIAPHLHRGSFTTPGGGSPAAAGWIRHPLEYLSYVWQVFLPRIHGLMHVHFADSWPAFTIFVRRGFGAFGWYTIYFPEWVYYVVFAVMLAALAAALVTARLEWPAVRRRWREVALLVLCPLAVTAGFLAGFFIPHVRLTIAEFGRYTFPAIAPLAVLVVASLHASDRRRMLAVGTALMVGMIALGYAGQLSTLTGFYA